MKRKHNIVPGDMVASRSPLGETSMYWPSKDLIGVANECYVGDLGPDDVALVLAVNVQPHSWTECCVVLAPSGAVGHVVVECIKLVGDR